MISSRTPIDSDDVARHYDELDYFYRHVWGEHVHHGLWPSEADRSSVEDATVRLLKAVTAPLGLRSGDLVGDIGCGYGASARWVAEHHGAHVTGLTLSPAQVAAAQGHPRPARGSAEISLGNWLENDLPDQSLDAAYAIESLAHMPDKGRFFSQLHRTLKPGARASLACWLTAPDLSLLERALMRTICHEGRLPAMGTMAEYTAYAQEAGLEIVQSTSLSREVERTWWIIAGRVLKGLFSDSRYLRFLLNRALRERLFVLTLPRLILAYRTGAMAYGLLTLRKPDS